MFAKDNIYGQSIVHCDDKKRIILPKFTYVEKNDSLVILNKINYLSIYEEEIINKKIDELEKMYIGYDNKKKKQVDLMLLDLYKSILKKVKVDAQHRIGLGGIEFTTNEFMCIGAKNYVILDPDTKKRNIQF